MPGKLPFSQYKSSPRRQAAQAPQHQDEVQGEALEPALDGIGHAEPGVERGRAGGLGDAPVQRVDQGGAGVLAEEAEDHGSGAEGAIRAPRRCLVKAATPRYGIGLVRRKLLAAPLFRIPE
jgi:hypothetical protein